MDTSNLHFNEKVFCQALSLVIIVRRKRERKNLFWYLREKKILNKLLSMVKHNFWWLFVPHPGLHILRVINTPTGLQFSPSSLWWHPPVKNRGFANWCGLFGGSAGHRASKGEKGSLCRLQEPRFTSQGFGGDQFSGFTEIIPECLHCLHKVLWKDYSSICSGQFCKRTRKLKCCGGTEKLLCLTQLWLWESMWKIKLILRTY